MTVQDLHDLFQRYKKDISDVDAYPGLFFDWCDEINRFAYRIMYGIDPERFILKQQYNVIPGTATYALPTKFLTLQPKGCGIFLVSASGTETQIQLPITGFGSSQEGYYINAGNIILTPVPTNSSIIKLRYIPEIDPIEADGDTLVIPDEYIYYCRDALDAIYTAWDESGVEEMYAGQRFAGKLDELARNLRKTTPTQGIDTYSQFNY